MLLAVASTVELQTELLSKPVPVSRHLATLLHGSDGIQLLWGEELLLNHWHDGPVTLKIVRHPSGTQHPSSHRLS